MPDNHPEPNNDHDNKKSKRVSFIAGFVLGVLFTFLVGLGSCFALLSGF